MRMLIVATCREQTSRLITMDANTERVELRGLGTEAIGELLTLAGLPAVRAVAVHAPTRGNALLTRELIRLLGEQPGNPPGMVPGAHAERFEAEQLFPAFRDAGLAPGLEEVTDFVTFDTDEFYLRA